MVFTLSVNNLTNRSNFSGFSGIQTSPFFLTPTSVQNPRKVDLGRQHPVLIFEPRSGPKPRQSDGGFSLARRR